MRSFTQTSLEGKNWLTKVDLDSPALIRLFCFPYSGAGSSIFRGWAASFPAEIEVCPVILPGRETQWHEKPISDLPNLVGRTAAALLPYFDRPFAFFGHSMGALLSFELARYLRRNFGHKPLHLFVSAHPAPHLSRKESPLYNLPDGEFIARLREMNGTDEAIFDYPELLDLVLPVLRADFSVCETYQYISDEPLECPVTAIGGLEDAYISSNEMELWKIHTRGNFRVRMLPGNHFFLKSKTMDLIEIIARELFSQIKSVRKLSAGTKEVMERAGYS